MPAGYRGRSPCATRHCSLPRRAAASRLQTSGGAGPGACARRSRACRPHSPHPLRELVTSCPRPSPSGVSQSLPVVAGESLLPPSYPLDSGSSGSSERGRQRGTDLIKFPETATTKKSPRWGENPIRPTPLQKPEGPLQVERCRGEPGFGGSRCPGERRLWSCPLRFRLLRWRRRLPRGGSSCQLPAPARRPPASPTARRDAVSRRRRRLGPRRDVVSCGASASAPAGTLWERVGPEPRFPSRGPPRPRQVGPEATSYARLSPRPPGLPSFRLPAGPPLELSKLGALGCGDRGSAGETPAHVRGGRSWAGRRGPRGGRGRRAPRLRPRARPPGTARRPSPAQPARPSSCAARPRLRFRVGQ